MPGINLSRSAEQATELKKYNSFGRGAVSILIVLILVIAAWIGIVSYEKKLVAEIDGIASDIAAKRGSFSSSDVDDVTDFQFRLEILRAGLRERVSPASMLGSIEGLLLPGIVLSKYSFDASTRIISISGKADTLGIIAKQMVLAKRVPELAGLSVDELSSDKDGKFSFSFSIKLTQ
jgi:hypothetical protein